MRAAPNFRRGISLQRTHSSRSRSTPAAAAEAGSKLSLASTSAHTSCRRVAPASAASITPVRPDEAGPAISLSAPRGRPPVSASSAATPVETVSGAARSRSSSVEERRSGSEDSKRARKVATDAITTLRARERVAWVKTGRKRSAQSRADQASTFAFYSPTGRILLRGVGVVNTL